MTFTIKLHGFQELTAELRNLSDRVPGAARKAMHRSADRIVREAKINTPVDTHALEESIRKEVSYGARNARGHGGRLQIDIVAGSGTTNPKTGAPVEMYAVQVHENYEGMLKKGPGPGTLAKMAMYPGRVGSKFLERALMAEQERLRQRILEAVAKEMK